MKIKNSKDVRAPELAFHFLVAHQQTAHVLNECFHNLHFNGPKPLLFHPLLEFVVAVGVCKDVPGDTCCGGLGEWCQNDIQFLL